MLAKGKFFAVGFGWKGSFEKRFRKGAWVKKLIVITYPFDA
jgi:hypothetical protein